MLFLFCAPAKGALLEIIRNNKSEPMVFFIMMFTEWRYVSCSEAKADVISITQPFGTEPGAVATGSKQKLKWVEQNPGLV